MHNLAIVIAILLASRNERLDKRFVINSERSAGMKMSFVEVQIDLQRTQTERTRGDKSPFNRVFSQAEDKSKPGDGIACI